MFFIGGLVLAKSLAADAATPGQYIMEEIKPGDTLWSLAKKHKEPGQDTRELVYDIKKVNGIDDGNIYPGQLIKVPGHTYAKDSRE
jgi:LysM repeat protein